MAPDPSRPVRRWFDALELMEAHGRGEKWVVTARLRPTGRLYAYLEPELPLPAPGHRRPKATTALAQKPATPMGATSSGDPAREATET